MTHPLTSTVLGYPRIGPKRELKFAVESYWAGRSSAQDLSVAASGIREHMLDDMRAAGLTSIPSNVFSLYDHVLDAAVAVDAVPKRYKDLKLSPLDTYFAMARGNSDVAPLEMTKWFDTNYHYLVPELGPDTVFEAVPDKPLGEYRQAEAAGVVTRPVLVGPVSFLLLSKPDASAPDGFAPLQLLDSLVECYSELLRSLHAAGVEWVQLDEPAFNLDRTPAELEALSRAYSVLAGQAKRPRILVAGGYGDFGPALPALLSSPIEALALDLVSGSADLDRLASSGAAGDKTVVAGLVDGRNVWRADLRAAATKLGTLLGLADDIGVSTSCSLLHVPVNLDAETKLDDVLRSRLAFARQKLDEVVRISGMTTGGLAVTGTEESTPAPTQWRDDAVRARLAALRPEHERRTPYAQRAKTQAERLHLPPLPTTTIGSFPQTTDVRSARAELRQGKIDESQYRSRMRTEIAQVIRLQERLGLDVLVHGEPERNDMVQYFAEYLGGFASTQAGWVQSYGSRCVRPPILYGDVTRPEPMTVDWSTYAQSLTGKHVKGMLTGPVTILAWSFVRDDQPLADTARQVALALRDEVRDLESAGLRMIQVDEPALRETLPPRSANHAKYLEWAVGSFRLATSGVSDGTQIHTHLCYSEFGEVVDAIADLDADVTSIEASRSRMEVLADLDKSGYSQGVGPGVYDIHSPRVPGVEEMAQALRSALQALPSERLWVNPDCGLKTRGYDEVTASLEAMVAAAKAVRADVA